jgi:hypothetical protein
VCKRAGGRGRSEDGRLEIPGCEVYRRRDVVGVRDVHVAPRQGVCLRVGTVKRVDMGKSGIGGFTVNVQNVKYLRGGSITEFPMKLYDRNLR